MGGFLVSVVSVVSVVLDVGDRKAMAPDDARSGKRRAQTTHESHPAKRGYGLRLGEDARGSEHQRAGKLDAGQNGSGEAVRWGGWQEDVSEMVI